MNRPRLGYDLAKRAFDLCVACLALVVLMPVMAATAILVRIKLGTPVLFRQPRAGKDQRPFVLAKFRTMRNTVSSTGELLRDEDRLTTFGRMLRQSSLDELPSLTNVVRGELSFVGPRPLPLDYLPLYSTEQQVRHEVMPGLTGWAQIHGRNAVDWDERLALDVWYVQHRSFLLDMRILARTVTVVLSAHGVSAPGQATMNRFTGPSSRT